MKELENKLNIWIKNKLARLAFFFVLSIGLWLIRDLPYINIVYNTNVYLLVIFILSVVIFELNYKIVFFICIILILFALFFTLLRSYERAEFIIDYFYGLLFVGIIKGLHDQ